MRRFSDEGKRQAIDLYFDQALTTSEVVERLGYPTRQNLERWLSKDPRYGDNFRHGFYSIETKTKAIIFGFLSLALLLNMILRYS